MIDAVFGFWTAPGRDGIGEIDAAVAAQFGLDGVSVLAVRPDRYIGFRDDGTDADAVAHYVDKLMG